MNVWYFIFVLFLLIDVDYFDLIDDACFLEEGSMSSFQIFRIVATAKNFNYLPFSLLLLSTIVSQTMRHFCHFALPSQKMLFVKDTSKLLKMHLNCEASPQFIHCPRRCRNGQDGTFHHCVGNVKKFLEFTMPFCCRWILTSMSPNFNPNQRW